MVSETLPPKGGSKIRGGMFLRATACAMPVKISAAVSPPNPPAIVFVEKKIAVPHEKFARFFPNIAQKKACG